MREKRHKNDLGFHSLIKLLPLSNGLVYSEIKGVGAMRIKVTQEAKEVYKV